MKKRRKSLIYNALARLKGIEPLAYRLGGGRSIQLSYKRYSIFMQVLFKKGFECSNT